MHECGPFTNGQRIEDPIPGGGEKPSNLTLPPTTANNCHSNSAGLIFLSPPSIHAGMLVALATLAAVVLQCPEDTQFTAFLYGLSFLKWILQFLSQVPQSASLH